MCDCDCEMSKHDKWEQIKREHAHELAEGIRGLVILTYEPAPTEASEAFAKGLNRGARMAADRIDSEVRQ